MWRRYSSFHYESVGVGINESKASRMVDNDSGLSIELN